MCIEWNDDWNGLHYWMFSLSLSGVCLNLLKVSDHVCKIRGRATTHRPDHTSEKNEGRNLKCCGEKIYCLKNSLLKGAPAPSPLPLLLGLFWKAANPLSDPFPRPKKCQFSIESHQDVIERLAKSQISYLGQNSVREVSLLLTERCQDFVALK